MVLCISVLSVVISPFSFLILLIWFFSLFSWWVWLWFIYFIYLLKKPAFSFIDFCCGLLCFSFIYFCPNFYDFFPSTNPGVLRFFLVALGVELGYLFDFSLVSWGKLVLLWTIPLALLLLSPIGFGLLCFALGCCIHFYAYFDFFCDLLVIQKCVV